MAVSFRYTNVPTVHKLHKENRMGDGRKANFNGSSFESVVEGVLKENGFQYEKQVKYTNLYGSNRCKIDFVVDNVYIECKFQAVSGSVDEKLPFCLHNLEQFENGMVILGGDHWYTDRGITIREWANKAREEGKFKSEVILFEDFEKRLTTSRKII